MKKRSKMMKKTVIFEENDEKIDEKDVISQKDNNENQSDEIKTKLDLIKNSLFLKEIKERIDD